MGRTTGFSAASGRCNEPAPLGDGVAVMSVSSLADVRKHGRRSALRFWRACPVCASRHARFCVLVKRLQTFYVEAFPLNSTFCKVFEFFDPVSARICLRVAGQSIESGFFVPDSGLAEGGWVFLGTTQT